MNARIGYCFFLTGAMVGLLYVLLFHPVQLSSDARTVLETVLAALSPILMHVVNAVFHLPPNPTPAAKPPQETK